MSFPELLAEFSAAVAAGDGGRFARCFAGDAEYHDVFYGTFRGRDAIADMLENRFHRDGGNYEWQMIEPVSDGRTGYARFLFSFDSKLEQVRGRRILMEGCGHFNLRDGLIVRYEDIVKTGEVLVQLGFPPERLHRVMTRMTGEQNATAAARRHLGTG